MLSLEQCDEIESKSNKAANETKKIFEFARVSSKGING